MAFDRCKTCKQYDDAVRHKCPPAWRVYIGDYHDPDDDTDGREVHANDAEEAATKGLEDSDDACAEGPTLDPVEVIVKRDGKVAGKYSVCGGIEVTYHARALVLT